MGGIWHAARRRGSDGGRAAPTRRGFLAMGGAAAALAGCANGVGSPGAFALDQRVASTLAFLDTAYAPAAELRSKSAGLLVMPLMTEAGLGIGGAYGRGALVIEDATVDYYSATQGSVGLLIGAQQYAHVLFFMTEGALLEFRTSPGWAAGAEIEYAAGESGLSAGADTVTALTPVIATVFAQSGLLAGASIEGTKYNRIIP